MFLFPHITLQYSSVLHFARLSIISAPRMHAWCHLFSRVPRTHCPPALHYMRWHEKGGNFAGSFIDVHRKQTKVLPCLCSMDTVTEEGKVGLGKGENLKNTTLTVTVPSGLLCATGSRTTTLLRSNVHGTNLCFA